MMRLVDLSGCRWRCRWWILPFGSGSTTRSVGRSHFLRQSLGLFFRQAGAFHQIFDQIWTFFASLDALLLHVGIAFLWGHAFDLVPFGSALSVFLLEEQHDAVSLVGIDDFLFNQFGYHLV